MAEIFNLNRARKAKAKADKTERATQNRALFGQTKAEKAKTEHARAQLLRTVEGAKRDSATRDLPKDERS